MSSSAHKDEMYDSTYKTTVWKSFGSGNQIRIPGTTMNKNRGNVTPISKMNPLKMSFSERRRKFSYVIDETLHVRNDSWYQESDRNILSTKPLNNFLIWSLLRSLDDLPFPSIQLIANNLCRSTYLFAVWLFKLNHFPIPVMNWPFCDRAMRE